MCLAIVTHDLGTVPEISEAGVQGSIGSATYPHFMQVCRDLFFGEAFTTTNAIVNLRRTLSSETPSMQVPQAPLPVCIPSLPFPEEHFALVRFHSLEFGS